MRPCDVELPDRRAHVAPRELLHDRLQRRVVLAHDRVELCGLHAGLLQLLIRSTGLDALVLTVSPTSSTRSFWLKTRQERVHLSGAGEARFVEHIESLLIAPTGHELSPGALQRARPHAGVRQQLGRAGRRGEALDLIASPFCLRTNGRQRGCLAGAGDALERHDPVARDQNLTDRRAAGPRSNADGCVADSAHRGSAQARDIAAGRRA